MQTYNKKQISSGGCLLIDTTAGNRKNYASGLTNQTNRWLCRVSGAIAVSLAMSLLDPLEVETPPQPMPPTDGTQAILNVDLSAYQSPALVP